MHRRTLIKLGVGTAVLLPLATATPAAAGDLPADAVATLRAVGAVALPASLGRNATDAAVDRFVQWVRGYRAGQVMDHGYGRTRVRRTAELNVQGYVDQLKQLEANATTAHKTAFTKLPAASRAALVQATLEAAGVQNLPPRPNGQHVVADLMAHYFSSSEANDVCYRAHIGRQVCRPVEQSFTRPRPL